ncbi:winged helix DNA-binding domain-containing protein, partial [Rhizodiscina lignyota]
TDDPDEIRKQIEFYFSDSNLYQDKYLFGLVKGSANRSVPLKTITSFKRMQRFQPYSAVVAAMRESETLDLIEKTRPGEEEIVRKVPIEAMHGETQGEWFKSFEDSTKPRSIYAKGFGEETAKTQIEIEEFFARYGQVKAVRLRRTAQRVFKGSVFVEFDTPETQKEFLEMDEKPKWHGKQLLIMSKEQYCADKEADIKAGKLLPNPSYEKYQGDGKGGRGR